MQVNSLTKKFSANVAVNQVSFSVPEPQMIGIIGRSGAGKSTLLRMLNRLTDATSGEVLINGQNILRLKGADKRAWQRDCAMIFQQFNLVPRLDVVTNVMLGRLNSHSLLKSVFKVFSKTDIEDAMAALNRLGIAEKALERVENLSGGQQQRVAIARGLMQQPQMILADEPIASLDPLSAEVVMKSLREIHERDNLTVICNLHTLDTARTYCTRVIGMRDGEMVFDGPANDLTTDAAKAIYGAGDDLNEAMTSTSLSNSQAGKDDVVGASIAV